MRQEIVPEAGSLGPEDRSVMECTSRQCGSQRLAVGFPVGMAVLCALAAPLLLITPVRGQATGTEKPIIRVVGPLAAKEMMEGLAGEFNKSKNQATLEYLRMENRGSAAGALVAGRDMMLSLGKVADKDLRYSKRRWKALAPEEQTIGARAVAIVVHERSAVESLTLKQLQMVFSGEAKDWTVFGGPRKSIRRYGLAFTDPLTRLFHEKVLSAGKCRMIVRKKDSQEALSALAGDPEGIAFVDAVAAASAGEGVKIVAIGAGGSTGLTASGSTGLTASKDAVGPNAQTIKDGTYPLARTLVLYVSPKASPAARDFARFILAGSGDAICRKHGFMPTLQAVRADVLAAFEKLYGPDIKRVKATPDTADDQTLAGQMIQSARTMKADAELLAAMCEAAYDLVASASGGETLAFEALGVLAERVPDKRFDCAVKRAALCERAYKAGKSRADGEHLVEALMTAADLGMSPPRFVEAADTWKKALAVAEEVHSPTLTAIRARLPAFTARVESVQEAKALAARLHENPQDVEARRRMLMLHLVELDDPAEASKYLDAASDEATKTNLPLAAEPLEKLPEEAALKLAEWYIGLVGKAGVGGKELMTARARACYVRFFALHKDREDALAMRAALGMQKVGGKVPDPPAEQAPPQPGRRRKPRTVNAGLKPGEEITDLKLAEFVAAHPDLTRLTRREIGTARQITDLRPLKRLTKLTTLELHQPGNIKDLSPLAKRPNLRSLTLTGLEMDDISALSGLSLTTLNISDARNVSDIAPIGRLLGLRTLNLSGCVKVSDLTPLSRLTGLTNLDLSGCEAVNDLAPLEKLARTLTKLNVGGTNVGYIMPLARMSKLKTLDLRRCEKIAADDVEWLAKRLSECKVLSDAPAKEPASADPGGW